MTKIDRIAERRNEIFRIFVEEFKSEFREAPGEFIVPLYFPIFVRNPARATIYLKRNCVESRAMFTTRGNSKNAEWLSKHTILIPCHQDLTSQEIEHIISTVKPQVL